MLCIHFNQERLVFKMNHNIYSQHIWRLEMRRRWFFTGTMDPWSMSSLALEDAISFSIDRWRQEIEESCNQSWWNNKSYKHEWEIFTYTAGWCTFVLLLMHEVLIGWEMKVEGPAIRNQHGAMSNRRGMSSSWFNFCFYFGTQSNTKPEII